MNDQVQPLIDLLSGQFGWMPTLLAWGSAVMTASRFVLKPFSARLQEKMTMRMAEAAASPDTSDDQDWEAVLQARWYRRTAFFLDFIFSLKLPTHADFARLLRNQWMDGPAAMREMAAEKRRAPPTLPAALQDAGAHMPAAAFSGTEPEQQQQRKEQNEVR